MKCVLRSFALVLSLTGCNHRDDAKPLSSDAILHGKVAGTWLREDGGVKGTLVLLPNGSFSAGYTNFAASPVRAWTFQGEWEIADGVCVSKLTKSQSWGTTNRQAVGGADRFRIIRVDDVSLVWESEGQSIAFTRSK